MRRRDREVMEQSEVLEILERCDTLRIGIQGAIVLTSLRGKRNLPKE